MKVITFSRQFQSKHPRKGEDTYFVEAILTQLAGVDYTSHNYFMLLCELNPLLPETLLHEFHYSLSENIEPKSHTIRAGNRFKEGESFSPRIWSAKPYASKQIIFAPPVELKKTWNYEVRVSNEGVERWFLNGTSVSESNEYMQQWFNENLIKEIAKNDGLELSDFLNWFNHPSNFSGQIICWNENIKY